MALHDWTKSSFYLGSFCLSSIATMATFAAAYWECTARCAGNSGRAQRWLQLFSAALALLGGSWVGGGRAPTGFAELESAINYVSKQFPERSVTVHF